MKNLKALSIVSAFLMLFSLSSCENKADESFKKTKIAVFADNQLINYQVSGNCEYSLTFLKNHLALCKEENVDVIVQAGDLVNNGLSTHYAVFETALKEVYGTDETKYPEFVFTMGNHEWWDLSETVYNKAIANFKKYARIKTSNLKKESSATIPLQTDSTSANYYKVVNGLPFLSISGSGPTGLLNYEERDEIKLWLNEISSLPLVKKGAPIFVSYHYPIKGVTYTFGQGASEVSTVLDDIIKDYPQVVLFSGDTHFSGANERSINQVNYTSINLGSSCYSRHVSKNALNEAFYNVSVNQGSKDMLVGEVAENSNKTPHIHIVEVDENGSTTLSRYFSTNDPKIKTKLGLTWTIPLGVSKDKFVYTNARFENKSWAQEMYKKDGLKWDDLAIGNCILQADKLVVEFPDVTDFNYCEYYKIYVTADYSNEYNYVSHYYKWEENSHNYSAQILSEDLPSGEITEVKIEAFDFFGNKSMNALFCLSK